MQTYEQTFTGATTWKLNIPGKYFTVMGTNLGVNVRFYLGGAQLSLGQIQNVLAGLEVTPAVKPGNEYAFDRVEIDALGADDIKVGIGNGDARYNRSQGNVAVTNTAGAFTHSQASVTNVNQQLLAANASRRYVKIQNNSATQWLRVKTDGTAATSTSGYRVAPGKDYESPAMFAPTGAISAMMEAADGTANNVEIITG